MQQSKSTHEALAEEVGYQKSFFELWDYLQDNPGATQKEILKDDDHRVDHMQSRPALSRQLNGLVDEGVVRFEKDGRIKQWFVVEEWHREPLKSPYDSVWVFIQFHWGLFSVTVIVAWIGCILWLYELFQFPLGYGPLPELLLVAGCIGAGIIGVIGTREVYL
jgi:hypothetical protein